MQSGEPSEVLIGARHWENWLAMRMILPGWFYYVEESLLVKKFCMPVKSICPRCFKNGIETPRVGGLWIYSETTQCSRHFHYFDACLLSLSICS